MLISTGLLLAMALAAQEGATAAAPVDTAAAALAEMRVRGRVLCETRPRPAGETVEACVERRVAAMVGTYGSPERAVVHMDGGPATQTGALGFPTLASGFEINGREAEARPEPAPREPRCRRESTSSEEETATTRSTSGSFTVICGNDDSGAARQMLDSLRRTPR